MFLKDCKHFLNIKVDLSGRMFASIFKRTCYYSKELVVISIVIIQIIIVFINILYIYII